MSRHGELHSLAIDLADEALQVIRAHQVTGVRVAETKSSAVDIVTAADKAAERVIRERLAELRPDDAIVGEEEAEATGTSGVRWIVDPIDGTVNFLYGRADCAVCIAVEVHGEVVAGVVRRIPDGVVFEATLGGGARRDGTVLEVRAPAPLAERLILTGFSYDQQMRAKQGAMVTALLPRVRDIRRAGSCALDLCAVAAGEADGYVEEGTHIWDHAAAGLIAREAGASTAVLTGAAAGRELVLCAPTHGWDEFQAAVKNAGFVAG